MRDLWISDLHFDCRRQTGTTPESVYYMERKKLYQFKQLIEDTKPDRTFILGDLFDRTVVENQWIADLKGIPNLHLIKGNHDERSSRYDRMASLELLSSVGGFAYYNVPTLLDNYYIIPHLFCQDDFDKAISAATENCIVTIHSNIRSGFAESELSLNLSQTQIDELLSKGCRIISGHEHTHQRLYDDRLVILGCFGPTRMSDCDSDKYVLVVEDNKYEFIKTWRREKEFLSVDWKEFTGSNHNIVEVTGTCTQEEAIEATKLVSEYRKNTNAYIVKGAIKVKGNELETVDLTNNKFDIVKLFLESLDNETRKVAERLNNELSKVD